MQNLYYKRVDFDHLNIISLPPTNQLKESWSLSIYISITMTGSLHNNSLIFVCSLNMCNSLGKSIDVVYY